MTDDVLGWMFFCVVAIALLVIGIFVGACIEGNTGVKEGYCQALADIEANRKPKYKLVKQKDGTTIWEQNYMGNESK